MQIRRVPRSYILFDMFCRKFLALAPKSGAFIGRKLVPGPPKKPYRYARFSVFSARGMWPTDSPFKKGKSYSVNEEPSATYSYSVNVHVATQLCADPTLSSVFGSGKSSKSSYSETLYSASRRRGIRYKLFWSILEPPGPRNSGVLPGYCRIILSFHCMT